MGLSLNQVQHLMITISVVFLVVSIRLTHQSNSHMFDQQSEASSDSSPDEFPVFDDATSSGEDDQPMMTIGIPEQRRFGSGSMQPSISLAEDRSGSLNEHYWGRNAGEVIKQPGETMRSSSKYKRSGCSEPSIRARGLVGATIFKRSHFATSRAEVAKRMEEDALRLREAKRNGEGRREHSLSCETSHDWRDLGSNHYPQFVKTAVCQSATCMNGLYACIPRDYSLKVLKRVSVTDTVCDEPHDIPLPESLNSDWRLVTVKITHCCDCSNRLANL